MKKFLVFFVLIGLIFPSVIFVQTNITNGFNRNAINMKMDSNTAGGYRADTSTAIRFKNTSGRLGLFVQMDSVWQSGGTHPWIVVMLQFADSIGLWSQKFNTTNKTFANDTLTDTFSKDSTRFRFGVVEE